ncbi:hypothetical protein [Conexibacter sp. SYSU D00693]|uniref:hypothetical protein n=1 Tax=Conexibacter sp. SYSU D00693 TaxID=2812560 RepID=UPI001F119F6F|nr:hypothetical protein [Conexibacter sp. SYSU D00693]
MDRRRALLPLLAAALLGLVLACACTAGVLDASVLHALPLLVLALPLLAGRYVGEDRLAALAAVVRARRARPVGAALPRLRRPVVRVARGGRLIAASLAERGPPALALAR